ncbi:MAG: hypothetical protein V1816_08030 [Pseudomonadota bacterium]
MTDNAQTGLLPPPRRRWLRSLALGLLILASGMVIGGALTLKFLWNRSVENVRDPLQVGDRITARMARRLGLNQSQKDRVGEIMRKHVDKIQKIRRQIQPGLDAAIVEAATEIKPLLDPAQTEKFEKDIKRLKRRLRELESVPPEKASAPK